MGLADNAKKFFSWVHLLSQKDGFFLQALTHNPLTVGYIVEIVAKKQNLNDFLMNFYAIIICQYTKLL